MPFDTTTHPHQYILLSDGSHAIVDPEDAERVRRHHWTLIKKPHGDYTRYAMTRINRTTVLMHQFILGKVPGKVIDHINGTGWTIESPTYATAPLRKTAGTHDYHGQTQADTEELALSKKRDGGRR